MKAPVRTEWFGSPTTDSASFQPHPDYGFMCPLLKPDGVSEAGDADRGAASAVYFTLYYAGGALAGFVPGLAREAWKWPGVAGLVLAALGIGLAALARPVRSAAAAT